MKGLKVLVILTIGVLVTQVSYADISDLNEELIEADAIGADSEAAIIESEELRKELAEEKAEAKRLSQKLAIEKEQAKIKRRAAEKDIASTEKKIADSRAQKDKMNKELLKIEKEIRKLRDKQEKIHAELSLVKSEEDQVTQQKLQEEQFVANMKRDHVRMKTDAKKTATRVSALRADVKRARIKIASTYRDMKKSNTEYRKMIDIYRRTLADAGKMLDELEMAIEVDRAYDQKLASMGKLKEGFRTVSGLNRDRISAVKSKVCNVRAYPSTKAEILDTYPKGKTVNMKYHSKSWFTVVHSGEKAFMGKGCFN